MPWSGSPSELVGWLFLFQAEVAQLQEQVALKDAEIERLHSQLSRTAALHNDHAEKGNWPVTECSLPFGPGPSLISGDVCLWVCVLLCEEACNVHVRVCVCSCVHAWAYKAQLYCGIITMNPSPVRRTQL